MIPEAAVGIRHGGRGSAYETCGCRCVECSEAHRARMARGRAKRRAQTKDPNDPRHGTASFAGNHGCQCEPCVKALKLKNAERYKARKAKA